MRLTTRAQTLPCPRCGATTIRALTASPGAYEAITDPVPLTAMTEAAALLKGKLTYDLVGDVTGYWQLIRRDQHRIKHRDHPVLATHQCPGPIPWTPPRPPVEEIQP